MLKLYGVMLIRGRHLLKEGGAYFNLFKIL